MFRRVLALFLVLPVLYGCYTEGDNASRLTTFGDNDRDAFILVGLSSDKRNWIFSGVTFVRINPATGTPYQSASDVIRFGRSDGQNYSQIQKPTYVAVKAKPGLYAWANFYVGSNDFKQKYTGRITGSTQAFEVRAGQVNYLGEYKVLFAGASMAITGPRSGFSGVKVRYQGHNNEAARKALTGFTSVKAPFAAVKAKKATLE